MAETTQAKKKRLRAETLDQLNDTRRMSMFGLRIETRADFDVENYHDFRNIRRSIKDKTHTYRIGPAPISDFYTKPKHYVVSSPGCLDSDLEDTPMSEDIKILPYPQSGTVPGIQPTHISRAGCRSLISYFAKLGRHEGDEYIDLEFVDSLLRAGADINFNDRYGQTCMHEISRDWHTDVAQFALTRGANVNKSDNYGRTPLHLAAAVNYPEMVFWLINNGADVDARTTGEEQTPIHYAAKYNADDALKVLLHMGANIADKDYKNRTPLFVAAEAGRSESCCFLLEQGAPAGIYDDVGRLALSIMVQKMPDVARIALGQFVTVDKALRKKYYYLNYLETDTWKQIQHWKTTPGSSNNANRFKNGSVISKSTNNNSFSNKKHKKSHKKEKEDSTAMYMAFSGGKQSLPQTNLSTHARSPLETICEYNEVELIMHPVILRLIAIKWQLYGNYRTGVNTAVNLFYTILWTSLGVTMPRDDVNGYYTPLKENIWRVVLEVVSLIMAVYFIVTQVREVQQTEKRERKYKDWKKRELERDILYCHERWPEEKRYLTSEINLIRTSSKRYLKNGWNGFEMFTNLVMAMVILTRVVAVVLSNKTVNTVHFKSFPFLLILLWLRFMRYCQIYQSLGPFITMLGHVIGDTLKFGFLFFEFFIPYVCAFWILFGGQPGEFKYFNDVIYQVFLMTLVDEYKRDFMEQDKVMSQVLVGTYLAIASVVCINLYIALMSQTFTRIYQNAKATAYMQQANHLLKIERSLRKAKKEQVQKFMINECSPQVVYDNGSPDDDEDDNVKLSLYRISNSLSEIKEKVGGIALASATSSIGKGPGGGGGGGGGPSSIGFSEQVHQSSNSTNVLNHDQNMQERLGNIEDTNQELNNKLNQITKTLHSIQDEITRNNVGKLNLPVPEYRGSSTSLQSTGKPHTDSSKQNERSDFSAEKRNSLNQKLVSIISALTKFGFNQGHQNSEGLSPPNLRSSSMDFRDQRIQGPMFEPGPRYIPPSAFSHNPYSTLPRGGGGGGSFHSEPYEFERISLSPHKFRSYQDINREYHHDPSQSFGNSDEFYAQNNQKRLRRNQSTPSAHHQPYYPSQREGYSTLPMSRNSHQDYLQGQEEPEDRQFFSNGGRYDNTTENKNLRLGEASRQSSFGSEQFSQKINKDEHRYSQLRLKNSRRNQQSRASTSNAFNRNTENADESDPKDEYNLSPTNDNIHISKDKENDIGNEKFTEENRNTEKVSGKAKNLSNIAKAYEKTKKSKSDIDKVNQLLNEHGYSLTDLKANFRDIEEEKREHKEQKQERQVKETKPSSQTKDQQQKQQKQAKIKEPTHVTKELRHREIPSELEDILVKQIVSKAENINSSSSSLATSTVDVDKSKNLKDGKELRRLKITGPNDLADPESMTFKAERLFQDGLKDTNV